VLLNPFKEPRGPPFPDEHNVHAACLAPAGDLLQGIDDHDVLRPALGALQLVPLPRHLWHHEREDGRERDGRCGQRWAKVIRLPLSNQSHIITSLR
jgi:hypothetical protein